MHEVGVHQAVEIRCGEHDSPRRRDRPADGGRLAVGCWTSPVVPQSKGVTRRLLVPQAQHEAAATVGLQAHPWYPSTFASVIEPSPPPSGSLKVSGGAAQSPAGTSERARRTCWPS